MKPEVLHPRDVPPQFTIVMMTILGAFVLYIAFIVGIWLGERSAKRRCHGCANVTHPVHQTPSCDHAFQAWSHERDRWECEGTLEVTDSRGIGLNITVHEVCADDDATGNYYCIDLRTNDLTQSKRLDVAGVAGGAL